MHQLGELDPGTRCMGFFMRSGGSREQRRRGSAAHAREGARQGGSRAGAQIAPESPERERGRVKGGALARPNIVRYNVTIPTHLRAS